MTQRLGTVRMEYVPLEQGSGVTWMRRASRALGVACVIGGLFWALRPIHPPTPQILSRSTPRNGSEAAAPITASLDRAAFDAQLWTIVERPPEPDPKPPPAALARAAPTAKPTPPPAQPKAQVLAIERDTEGGHTAFVFDTATGDLSRVRVGDRMGPFEVQAIDAQGVRLRSGPHSINLHLDRGPDVRAILKEFADG